MHTIVYNSNTNTYEEVVLSIEKKVVNTFQCKLAEWIPAKKLPDTDRDVVIKLYGSAYYHIGFHSDDYWFIYIYNSNPEELAKSTVTMHQVNPNIIEAWSEIPTE